MHSLNRVHNSCHTRNKRQREKFIGSNPISCSIDVLSYPYALLFTITAYMIMLFIFFSSELERNFKASNSRTSRCTMWYWRWPRWIFISFWVSHVRSNVVFRIEVFRYKRLVFVYMQRMTYKENQNNAIFNWFNKIKLIHERTTSSIINICLLCFVFRSAPANRKTKHFNPNLIALQIIS